MIRVFFLAILMIAGLAAPALADSVATTRDGQFAYIRSGPGLDHPAVCLAWPGVRFTVSKCTRYWCKAHYLQSVGWVSKSRIVIWD